MAEVDPRTILLVDDDSDIIISFQAILEANFPGYRILTANNGNKAVEICEKERPGVILIDMMLPGRSGFLVIEGVRKALGTKAKEAPFFIMFTGNTGKRHQMYAESFGVVDYMVKPVKSEKLLASVKSALARYDEVPTE